MFEALLTCGQGVSSMPAALRDERLANVRGPQRELGEINITRPDDAAMVQALVARVSAWLQVRGALRRQDQVNIACHTVLS